MKELTALSHVVRDEVKMGYGGRPLTAMRLLYLLDVALETHYYANGYDIPEESEQRAIDPNQ